uniref:AIG1-type G domain-containing protein n=1 Tax=Amphimedon queenslandica TaxID=400682 RepID=A0A1X7TDX1_AMPQE
MATVSPDASQSGNDVLTPEMKKKIEVLRCREEPVNILVIGPTGAGKSTLINSMFGEDVAEVGHGAAAITTEVKKYEGGYKEVKISIYDTVGFGDPGGKSGHRILLDIAKKGKFDLILICSQLGGRADRGMFLELASMLHKEMWKRTVVVLTQADRLDSLGSVGNIELAEEFKKQKKLYKECISSFLSKSVKKEVLEKIPYCIAGLKAEKKLPTTEDWLKQLWDRCIDRSSDDTRSFLKAYAKYRQAIEFGALVASVGAGTVAGGGIGAAVGSVVPGVGTTIGAGVGAGMGAFLGGSTCTVGAAVKHFVNNDNFKK